jgi:hypothetical protein
MLTGARTVAASCACGWEGWYTTPGYASKAHREHSCEQNYTPVQCAIHEHGSAAHNKHCGCRCWPCRLACTEQEAARSKARAYGRCRLVDAGPTRAHVLALMKAGMGWPRIVELSGVNATVIRRLVWGKRRNGRREFAQRVTRETEAALLAVTWNPANGGRPIASDTTARRLRALVALGWYPALLAREVGWNRAYFDRVLYATGKQARVRPGTARRVHEIYRRLVDAPPPSGTYADRARRLAATRGWAPPLRVHGRALTGLPIDEERWAS